MLLDIVKKGSTDRGVTLRIIDSTDGSPETGVVYNTSGIDLWYRRQGGAKVSITEATLSALTDAHSDGGFLHIADGVYRLDLPDAAFASGAQWVDVGGTVTGMIVIGGRVRLVDLDLETVIANQVWDALLSGHTTPSSMAIYLASLVAGQTTIATQTAPSGIQGSVGLASANLATLLAAIQAAADSVTAKLPSDGAKMAGEGATAKTLDDVTDAATITLTRDLEPPLSALTFYVSRRSDGTYACDRPLRLRAGSVEDQRVGLSMKRLGNGTVTTVGTAAVSGSGLTATSPGRFDEMATLVIGGTIASGASHTVDVAVTFEGNVFFVRLVVEAVD